MKKKIILNIFMCVMMMQSVVCASTANSVTELSNSVKEIVGAISYFGYAIALGMLAYVGIKYTMAPANEKADIKQGSINYLIGAFLIVCASGVATVASTIAHYGSAPGLGLAEEIIDAAQSAANEAGGGTHGGGGGTF